MVQRMHPIHVLLWWGGVDRMPPHRAWARHPLELGQEVGQVPGSDDSPDQSARKSLPRLLGRQLDKRGPPKEEACEEQQTARSERDHYNTVLEVDWDGGRSHIVLGSSLDERALAKEGPRKEDKLRCGWDEASYTVSNHRRAGPAYATGFAAAQLIGA